MATIYLPNDLRATVDELAGSGKPFPTNMELSIFAAMVGHSESLSEEVGTNNRGNEIPESIYKNNDRDGMVYLLALDETGDPDILREEKNLQAWKIFESYAAGGLRKIHEWMVNNPTDHTGVDTLLSEIAKIANDYKDREKKPVTIDLG